jgi:archaellum component FlaC
MKTSKDIQNEIDQISKIIETLQEAYKDQIKSKHNSFASQTKKNIKSFNERKKVLEWVLT